MTAPKPHQRFVDLPPAQQAGIICNEPRFQQFTAQRCDMRGAGFNSSAAAEYLRRFCRITSRRDLNSNNAALNRFNIRRTEFDAWTGKIPTPR